MTYSQAIEKSLQVPWKIGTCSQGEQCWCRTIVPVEPIMFLDGEELTEFMVCRGGEIQKEIAEYFVAMHNTKFQAKLTTNFTNT